MRSSPPAPIVRELALLLALSTCWGGSYTFIRIGVETIPPVTLIAARTLVAGLLLLGIARGRGLHLPRDGRTWTAFLLQAVLNSVVPFTLIAWAEQTVNAALATVLNATSPLSPYCSPFSRVASESPRFASALRTPMDPRPQPGIPAGPAHLSVGTTAQAYTCACPSALGSAWCS